MGQAGSNPHRMLGRLCPAPGQELTHFKLGALISPGPSKRDLLGAVNQHLGPLVLGFTHCGQLRFKKCPRYQKTR